MTDADFDYIRKLLVDRSAIVLGDDKRYLVEARLAPVIGQLNVPSISDLVSKLRLGSNPGMATKVIEALVTSETSFFRDISPFEVLRKQVLPELIAARASERKLTFWSAACSTGQEPYTIALMLREYFPELANWQITILGTDISTEVIAKAKEGIYSQFEANRGLPAKLMVKYFKQIGTTWQLDSSIRDMVEYRPFNLAAAWPGLPVFDVVLLRNVMIYFDVLTKREILTRVERVLRPDGYLVLGGSETTLNISDTFSRVERAKGGYYQRREYASLSRG
ncbi:MAG: CheR family methyltransferase [Bryobacteraceae bacterium]